MNLLLILAFFAIPSLLVQVAPQQRRRAYLPVLAISLCLGSIYGFVENEWPAATIEALWAIAIAYYGIIRRRRSPTAS